MRYRAILLFVLLVIYGSHLAAEDKLQSFFYEPTSIGSDALYNPASAFFTYSLDALQLPDNFDTEDYNDDLAKVWDLLRHPRRAINNEGGFSRFFNREIFPIDSEHRRDSFAALPNYALHLLGDGLTYRRDVEWFRTHGYRYPRLTAATIAMISEVLQEGLESQNTTDADAIADVYIFRPLGILLYSHEGFARAIKEHLNPSIWPTITAWDLRKNRFINTGIAYVYRPPRFRWGDKRLFIHTGFNNMFGLSHRRIGNATLTWSVGAAVEEIVRQRNIQADLKPSAGLFLDREGSLLWSLILNDTGDQRLRLNVFPRSLRWLKKGGFYLSINEDNRVAAGFMYGLPLGLGVTNY